MNSFLSTNVRKLLIVFALFFTYSSLAQNVTGIVKDDKGQVMQAVSVSLQGSSKGAVTDKSGAYTIKNVTAGKYVIVATFIGFKTSKKEVTVGASGASEDFALVEDALELESVIVTGTFDQRTKLESSVAITTMNAKGIEQKNSRGTGDFLQSVPGNFVDNSGGETEAKIYPRGLVSANSGNGTGYRYVSLQEDGLPVMGTLLGFATPDMFHRVDGTVGRFEAIRGGSASVTSANSPGGIYNFISKEGGKQFGGDVKIQYGGYGNSRSLVRTDLNIGGPIASGWGYNIGGFYRKDDGGKIIPFPANEGGQIKFNLTKRTEKGHIKLYAKYLSDRVITYRNTAVTDLETQTAFAGWDNNYSSTIATLKGTLPDGEFFKDNKSASRSWDSKNGNKVTSTSIGLDFSRDLGGGFYINNNAKYSSISNRYNQVTAEQVLPTAAFNAFGASFIKSVATGEELYTYSAANPTGTVNKLGNFIMLVAPLDMRNDFTDFQDILTFTKKAGNHSLAFGGYYASSSGTSRWDGDLSAQTLEPNPRVLQIQANNPFKAATGGVPALLDLTDANGFYSYNSITYVNFKDKVTTTSGFLNDVWQLNDKVNIDAGIRFESINHVGKKEGWSRAALGTLPLPASLATVNQLGGDGKYGTRYDTDQRIGKGQFFDFDFTHSYVSGSLGLNYKLAQNSALYGRYTFGNKAPDMDFYINNYVNVPIVKGPEEKISQAEIGFKTNSKTLALAATGFISNMADVPYTILISNTVTGESFYTPPTFNKLRTLGLELEANYHPINQFNLAVLGTFQSAEFTDFSFYNVNGFLQPVFVGESYPKNNPSTGSPYLFADNRLTPSAPQGTPNSVIPEGTKSYHVIEKLDGKKVDNLPSVILDVTPSFQFGKFLNIYANWRYTGERFYNKQNALTMPAYSVINAGLTLTFSKLDIGVRVNNLANNATIVFPDALGRPGAAGADAIKSQDIQAHKAAGYPFWGRTLLPRSFTVSVGYKF
jgi:iron complex outermembrane recepter protein